MAVGGEVGSGRGETCAFDALARALAAALSVPLVLISVVTPSGLELVGTHQVEQPQRRVVSATALCGQVARTGKPVIVHDVARRIAAGSDAIGVRDVAGYAGVPVLIGNAAVGAVAALAHRVRAWSARDVELLRGFADAVAAVVATDAALVHERALSTLLLRGAVATRADEVVAELVRCVGWSRAQLVTADGGRGRATETHEAVPRRGDDETVFAVAIPDCAATLELFTTEASPDTSELARIAPPIAGLLGAVLRRTMSVDRADPRTDELEALALHDELTGLLNRRGFYAVASGQLAIARRKSLCGMVLFIDVDGLKDVNDRHGHGAGDTLLRLAGTILRGTFRAADTIGRVGGDEFVVLSIDATDQDVPAVTDRLSRELARANEPVAATVRVRWSVGHVCFDGVGVESLDSLIAEADRRMYAAKRCTQIASSHHGTGAETT